MAFRVYLSYSLNPAEMTLAWRLQTLAAAHGIEMFVPQHVASIEEAGALNAKQAIDRADCVLAIITSAVRPSAEGELEYARKLGKIIIPIVSADLANNPFLATFQQIFTFSPWDNPGTVETKIVEYLKAQQMTKEKQQTIGALAALGLGLLVLFALNKD